MCIKMYEETPKMCTNKTTHCSENSNRMTSHYRNNPQVRNAYNPLRDTMQIEFMIL